MKFIVTCLVLYINIIAANKSKPFVENQHKLTVTCMDPEDCTKQLGEGYNCTNNSCKCQEEVCDQHVNTPKISAIVNVINEQCDNSEVCKVKHSICNDGYCRCEAGKVASDDKRKCLPISRGLDDKCIEDIQCISKIPNSKCLNDVCVCNEIHNQDKFSCVPKVGLGGKCSLDVECSHIKMSKCGLIKCECDQGFIPSENKEQCLPVAKDAKDVCEENGQCRQLYGESGICRINQCDCDAAHHLVNDSICPYKLKKFCNTDEDCMMYKDDISMNCFINRCECSPLYIEVDGICNGANTITIPAVLVIYIIFLVIRKV